MSIYKLSSLRDQRSQAVTIPKAFNLARYETGVSWEEDGGGLAVPATPSYVAEIDHLIDLFNELLFSSFLWVWSAERWNGWAWRDLSWGWSMLTLLLREVAVGAIRQRCWPHYCSRGDIIIVLVKIYFIIKINHWGVPALFNDRAHDYKAVQAGVAHVIEGETTEALRQLPKATGLLLEKSVADEVLRVHR